MMHEYLLYHHHAWWHFFIRPFYGLCYRKLEGGRFGSFEVLLQDATEDFYATESEGHILLVCQDQAGSIIYLSLDDDIWHKTILLESKSAKAYPKHFMLLPINDFVNLFYTIQYHEKQMLVHQIIAATDRAPSVIDTLSAATPPFLIIPGVGTDASVLYTDENGRSGERLFRWSQKHFGHFVPLYPEETLLVCSVHAESGGRIRYLAYKKIEAVFTLQYFEKRDDGTLSEPVTLDLDCSPSAEPILLCDRDKLYAVWQEEGVVMSVSSQNDGVSWSRPVRYTRPAGTETVLYTICHDGRIEQCYGYNRDNSVELYIMTPLVELPQRPESPPKPQLRPEGADAAQFAAENGLLITAPSAPDPLVLHLREEVTALKGQLLAMRQSIMRLSERLEQPEGRSAPLASDEADIDDVLLTP